MVARPFGTGLEADAAVIGLVADQQHQAMALALASFSARSSSARPTPRLRNGGSTVSGPSSNALVSPTQIGNCRTEPTSSVPIRAVNDRSSR